MEGDINMEDKYLLVDTKVLPDVFKKVILVKDLLNTKKLTI